MILIAMLIIPIAAGLLAWPIGHYRPTLGRWICLLALLANLCLSVSVWTQAGAAGASTWLAQVSYAWIPQFGIRFTLAMDGMSLLLVVLTNFLGIMGVMCSWESVKNRVGFFHFNIMWLIAALIGVFVAMDMFLFYFFWELMLVPLYLIIGIWGHERRIYATIKFFIFTQAGSLLLLVAIIALAYLHRQASGVWTFDYNDLLNTPLSRTAGMWLMLGFFAAFAVKLPAFGLHTWLPDAHTEAPTAGSVLLAGLVLKAGAYGMLRFLVPLFPDAVHEFAPIGMTLAVVGIVYGAVTAFGQRDLKRLVAYTSVSHMGFVLLAVFAWNTLALQGAMIVILAHGLTTGAMFILVGALQDRIGTRD
ncbi:MAG: NADH-quinone oxidoreductase subunit M, partial [Planctomycetaceae bacterium]